MVPPLNVGTFEAFFHRWLMGQEHYLQELFRSIEKTGASSCGHNQEDEVQTKNLIDQVISHYVEYFEAKSRAVRQDVFVMLTPPWFTSYERLYFWIGGYRTGMAFRLVTNNVLDLTEDQSRRINAFMTEIKVEEQGLTDELARLQASPVLLLFARHRGRPRNGELAEMESAFERLRTSMEDLVQSADLLRRKTIVKLMETLKPCQMLRFLAAITQLQLRLRSLGMHREAQIQIRHSTEPQTDQN